MDLMSLSWEEPQNFQKSSRIANDDVRKVNSYLQVVLKGKKYSHSEPIEY